MRPHRLPILLTAALASLWGCALWQTDKEDSPSTLPAARMSPDAVTLEFATVEIPHDAAALGPALWALVDEQRLPLETRRKLEENGFRCGLLGAQLPPVLQKHLSALDEAASARPLDLTHEGAPVDIAPVCAVSIKQLRSGRRTRLLAGPVRNELAALLCDAAGVRGETFREAQCVFSVTPYLESDGRVRVDLSPEIEHGEAKPNWVAGEGTIMLQTGKERRIFESLRFAASLAPGQTLLVTCQWPPRGLGGNFFSQSQAESSRQLFLLVRLAQTQLDDVFIGDLIREPLVTPLD